MQKVNIQEVIDFITNDRTPYPGDPYDRLVAQLEADFDLLVLLYNDGFGVSLVGTNGSGPNASFDLFLDVTNAESMIIRYPMHLFSKAFDTFDLVVCFIMHKEEFHNALVGHSGQNAEYYLEKSKLRFEAKCLQDSVRMRCP